MANDSKRVRYEKSPLIEVVFQLSFPTILSINSNQPVDFQEKIRERYPFFEDQLEEFGDFVVDPKQRAAEMRKMGENKKYSFISADRHTKISLTPSFIAISTMAYTQWEEFKEHIQFVVPVFEDTYRPSFYTRVGLRYTNAVTRSKLGLEDKKWTELIQPHILGMVAEECEDGVKSYLSEIEYETTEPDVLSKSHFEFVHVNEQKELSLLIDCDYYMMGVYRLEEMEGKAEKLHNASNRFIRTAITEDLHLAMVPVEIRS